MKLRRLRQLKWENFATFLGLLSQSWGDLNLIMVISIPRN